MDTIQGDLHVEVAGPSDAPPMLFIHPNPLDSASWLYQMAHFSTWYRCVAVDLPGYGRSPAAGSDVTMTDIAGAVWQALDRAVGSSAPAVLVGCSIGSHIAEHMYHLRPDDTRALVLSGTGWDPVRAYIPRRVAQYSELGIEARRHHAMDILSPAFRSTPMASWLADLVTERNAATDVATIISMFETRTEPDPDWFFERLDAPVLILTGTEDAAHASAFMLRARLPNCRLRAIAGAGHACYFEQPWTFDAEVLAFLDDIASNA
jgi:3-oxoadipate enol-lactonase